MKHLNKCEICESNNIQFLFTGNDKLLGVPGEFSSYKCNNCKVYFLNPQPSFVELEKYYSHENYYSLQPIDTTSKKLKFKLFLYKTYFGRKNNPLLKLLFSPFKFITRGTKIIPNLKLLDIGSGSGQFLYEMKTLGLNVCGVEPGNFNKKDYGLNIKNTDLLSSKYPNNTFDLITINNVFEHLNNPIETIIEIKRILKKDGTLIIDIPNTNSLANWIFGKNWLALDIPRHLFVYSNKNIRFLLEKNGFNITKIRHNSRPNQFVNSLYYFFGTKTEGNRILDIIFLPLTWLVNLLKIGDAIEIYCSPSDKQ